MLCQLSSEMGRDPFFIGLLRERIIRAAKDRWYVIYKEIKGIQITVIRKYNFDSLFCEKLN